MTRMSSSVSVWTRFGRRLAFHHHHLLPKQPPHQQQQQRSLAMMTSMDTLRARLQAMAPAMAQSLIQNGYFATDAYAVLDAPTIQTLRREAMELRHVSFGRFEPSWSEKINKDGRVERFDKPGVFACEPGGEDYDTAPNIITYMAVLIHVLPLALNSFLQQPADGPASTTTPNMTHAPAFLSDSKFSAKLAVTQAHSEYPLHIDNSQGLADNDFRKLTCILYLNPDYDATLHQGQLRLYLPHNQQVDIEPSTTFVCFWTDEIPHKVLPTGNTDKESERYALTIWLADQEPYVHIHNPLSPFAKLGDEVEFGS